jgi:hypothetical protein
LKTGQFDGSKATGVIMENDDESPAATKKLQDATRTLMAARYGARRAVSREAVLERPGYH